MTSAAREYLNGLLEMTGEAAILLSVTNKGCGGHSYRMDFVDAEFGGETVDLGEDRRLILHDKSLLWLFGVVIDYQDDGFNQQVVFTNPQETGRCGCGMSFTCGR